MRRAALSVVALTAAAMLSSPASVWAETSPDLVAALGDACRGAYNAAETEATQADYDAGCGCIAEQAATVLSNDESQLLIHAIRQERTEATDLAKSMGEAALEGFAVNIETIARTCGDPTAN